MGLYLDPPPGWLNDRKRKMIAILIDKYCQLGFDENRVVVGTFLWARVLVDIDKSLQYG